MEEWRGWGRVALKEGMWWGGWLWRFEGWGRKWSGWWFGGGDVVGCGLEQGRREKGEEEEGGPSITITTKAARYSEQQGPI
ncbi:uncharacterized protein G2W53_018004 [Senna tora]|uniref:Uncharacterized protein n=1 Tax=Senna tora TaxID=362788 RepID=A0A834TV34_9FABA|nr:uncharacterized protein G2W53_018004 [Senna tora]